MRQNLPCACVPLWALLALFLGSVGDAIAAPTAAPSATVIVKSETAKPKSAAKSKRSMRQFTGVVTALDKTSMTVEKSGKKPSSMVFVRDEAMKTTGDLEKNVRVTVYYRDRDGRAVAHRVVVKSGETSVGSEG